LCGIFGIWTSNKLNFKNLLKNLEHRGPDETWFDKWDNLFFGFTRLKIKNIDKDIKNVFSKMDKIIAFLNGEIYNCQDLAKIMGVNKNQTEFELIKTAYETYGADFVTRLDGMFAIFLLDKNNKKLFLFRDSIGIKPLYYFVDQRDQVLIISSDIKSICACELFHPKINEKYLINKHVLGFSDYNENLFEGIKQIPPSHYLKIILHRSELKLSLKKYLVQKNRFNLKKNVDFIIEQQKILEKSMYKRYSHSDVYPIGLMLSGGIDSSLLLFLAKRIRLTQINCFFLGSETNPDYIWANKISKIAKYPLFNINITMKEFLDGLPKAVYLLSGLNGFASYFLSKKVKEFNPRIKILICGEGSDEFYGGYNIYLKPEAFWDNLHKKIQEIKLMDKSTKLIEKVEETLNNYKDEQDLIDFLFELWSHEQLVNNHLLIFDHGTLANSIETRVPYLDLCNIEFVRLIPKQLKINNGKRKWILKLTTKPRSTKIYLVLTWVVIDMSLTRKLLST